MDFRGENVHLGCQTPMWQSDRTCVPLFLEKHQIFKPIGHVFRYLLKNKQKIWIFYTITERMSDKLPELANYHK